MSPVCCSSKSAQRLLAQLHEVLVRDDGVHLELHPCAVAGAVHALRDADEPDSVELAEFPETICVTQATRLREHLLRRVISTSEGMARIRIGTKAEIASLLVEGTVLVACVFIVQPGVGRSPARDVSTLLAAANAYLIGAQVEPLRVIGSA